MHFASCCAVAGVPKGAGWWVTTGAGVEHRLSPMPLSFDEAVSYCASRGAVLALPRTDAENVAISESCQDYHACWLNVVENAEGNGWVDGSGNTLT